MTELERTPYVAESIRVRCPSCRRLYMVQYGDIQETKPRFECVQCHSRFWLSLPDMDLSGELSGIPLDIKEAPVKRAPPVAKKETEPCPKCFKPVLTGSAECGHCGVLIEKARNALTIEETGVSASLALELAWKRVIGDYGDELAHLDFVRVCQRDNNLVYAAFQYGQMLSLMPSDEMTQRKIREVRALAATGVPAGSSLLLTRGRVSRLWQVALFGAALLIVCGVFIPYFRPLMGVGAAFLFLGVALQVQMRRRI